MANILLATDTLLRHKNGTSVWVGQRSHGCGMLVLSCFAHHLAYTWALDALVKTIPLDRRDLGVLAFENELAWAIRDEVAVDRGAWTADVHQYTTLIIYSRNQDTHRMELCSDMIVESVSGKQGSS